MRRFILFYGLIAVALVGLIVMWYIQSGAEETLVRYQKTAAFSPREMTYVSAVHPLSGDGVVLYGVQWPGISATHRAERVLMRVTSDEIVIKATDVQVDVGQALADRYGDDLVAVFRAYRAPADILTKPFETAALLGIDRLTGDWELTVRPQGEAARVSVIWKRGRKPVAQVDATVYIPAIERGRLWGWTRGWMTDMTVRIDDMDLLRAYAGYLTASGNGVPGGLAEAVARSEPLAMHIELQQPLMVANWVL